MPRAPFLSLFAVCRRRGRGAWATSRVLHRARTRHRHRPHSLLGRRRPARRRAERSRTRGPRAHGASVRTHPPDHDRVPPLGRDRCLRPRIHHQLRNRAALPTLARRRGVHLTAATRRSPLPADQGLRAPGTYPGHSVQLRRDPALPVIAHDAHGVRRRRRQRRAIGRGRGRIRVPLRAARGGPALRPHRRLIPGR